MTSRDPQHTPSPTPADLDRLPVRTPADLARAIAALAETLGRATRAGNTPPELVAQAERQVAKAVEQAHAAPIDKTMLLIHLVAARAFLMRGRRRQRWCGPWVESSHRCMRWATRRPQRSASCANRHM